MATRYNNTTLYPYSGSADTPANAGIQGWSQFIEDTLVTTGHWQVAPDTGQTLPSALTGGGAANTKKGYRIYKMNDGLQDVYPIFLRIDYGCGVNLGNSPSIWLTIGTGSNGSGTITGVMLNSLQVLNANNTTSPAGFISYGSASTNRVSIALFNTNTSGANVLLFTIQRTKNAQGSDTGDGILLLATTVGGSPNNLSTSLYVMYGAQPTQPAAEKGLSWILSANDPSESFAPGDIGLGIPIHFKGTAQQPGTNLLICNSNDVAFGGIIRVVLYGTNRFYVQLGAGCTPALAVTSNVGTYPNGFNVTAARLLLRYD